MEIKMRTFEDLLGNLADDAKQAFDQILERPGARQPTGVSVGQGLANPAGDLTGSASGLAGSAAGSVGDLAALPEQIGQLSELIGKLLPAVESLTKTIPVLNPMGAAGGSQTPT